MVRGDDVTPDDERPPVRGLYLTDWDGSTEPPPAEPSSSTAGCRRYFGLQLLSPVCAEYLIGYDESIAHPLRMLGGLVLLAPLYGTVAVLVREIARRTGRGWPTMLLLSAAFGLVQTGLVDQSLFHPRVRGGRP